ncbi:MAG: SHOCT domain-containing protein [Desulfohalobiaceae bacterium]
MYFDIINNFQELITLSASRGGDSWAMWPFGPGFTGNWLLSISKFLFIGVVLALILGLLRWAFGPGGFLRDPDLDQEEDKLQSNIQEALSILEERLAQGAIAREDYDRLRDALLK